MCADYCNDRALLHVMSDANAPGGVVPYLSGLPALPMVDGAGSGISARGPTGRGGLLQCADAKGGRGDANAPVSSTGLL